MNEPFLTAALPGTGGTIRETAEDFLVEEIPLYLPCGEGEHLYVEVEKRGLTTFELLNRLSRALSVREREMGYAGLKDARAATRQTISIPGVAPDQVLALNIPGVRFLSARFHQNKLRPGHLAGNRFRICIREVNEEAGEKAREILSVLEITGVPNYFGEQRYGVLGNSHLIGEALLREDYEKSAALIVGDPEKILDARWREGAERFAAGDLRGALSALPGRCRNERELIRRLLRGEQPARAVFGLPKNLLRLYLSAFQSHLFNHLVAGRLDGLNILKDGDLAYKHENGACFLVENSAIEQPRADRFEISPSAPLYGSKVTLAGGKTGALEQELLEIRGIGKADFKLSGGLSMAGERRPMRVPLTEIEAKVDGGDLVLSYFLPRGSYATSVLREIIKQD